MKVTKSVNLNAPTTERRVVYEIAVSDGDLANLEYHGLDKIDDQEFVKLLRRFFARVAKKARKYE